MTLTPDHIRLATGKQLARLVGVSENTITSWTYGRHSVSGYALERVQTRYGIPKAVLLAGLDARRADATEAVSKQAELEQFLNLESFEVA